MPTIAAIATPSGEGGIAIIRISGPGARELLERVFVPHSKKSSDFPPWRLRRGVVLDGNDEALDDALAVFMPGPRTFTGEDVAEIHCHGGPLIVELALANLLRLGARQAERGEFSRRAFLNGRMDLSQAEAVAEMIAAPSREALRYGLNRLEGRLADKIHELRADLDQLRAWAGIGVDFPDDEIVAPDRAHLLEMARDVREKLRLLLAAAQRARLFQNGAHIVLTGAVNAGKSSLLNALAGRRRALVTPIPGTTRDFIEERLDLAGLPAILVDTAGIRAETSTDPVETLGMEESRGLLAKADLALIILDGAICDPCAEPDPATAEILGITEGHTRLLVWNKSDLRLPECFPPAWGANIPSMVVSALNGRNLEELAAMARRLLLAQMAPVSDGVLAPNARQAEALRRAGVELTAFNEDLRLGRPQDCCLAALDAAAVALEDILGIASPTELLDKVFSQFCIGK